jgi:hypothetical protein
LQLLGERLPSTFPLVLVGGSALALPGSPRPTIDIDFVGDDVKPNKLHQAIMQIGKELNIDVEPVPIERFVPLPEGSDKRRIYVGQFGNLNVYVADPYSIALSKLDRGFDTDIDDIIFYVVLDELERITIKALSHARKFDLHPEIREHLQELKARLK